MQSSASVKSLSYSFGGYSPEFSFDGDRQSMMPYVWRVGDYGFEWAARGIQDEIFYLNTSEVFGGQSVEASLTEDIRI